MSCPKKRTFCSIRGIPLTFLSLPNPSLHLALLPPCLRLLHRLCLLLFLPLLICLILTLTPLHLSGCLRMQCQTIPQPPCPWVCTAQRGKICILTASRVLQRIQRKQLFRTKAMTMVPMVARRPVDFKATHKKKGIKLKRLRLLLKRSEVSAGKPRVTEQKQQRTIPSREQSSALTSTRLHKTVVNKGWLQVYSIQVRNLRRTFFPGLLRPCLSPVLKAAPPFLATAAQLSKPTPLLVAVAKPQSKSAPQEDKHQVLLSGSCSLAE
mmetsp:Transcript_43964/g.86001  ORF Transcript_43964/g.86001 Transcript_43964/m.86001 type:complete len:266 (-) Transcript_43964:259-1056(-)